MIRVVAVITAKPGLREELLALFRANVPNVRAEAGCIEYAPFLDAEGFAGFQAPVGPERLRRAGNLGGRRRAQGARSRSAYGGLRPRLKTADRRKKNSHFRPCLNDGIAR